MPVMLPAMKHMISQFHGAGAVKSGIFINHSGFKRRQCHHHLKGRPRRILSGNRFVGQRITLIIKQSKPIFMRYSGCKQIRIKRRHRNKRQNLAAMHIKHHCGPAVVAKSILRKLLQAAVNSQAQTFAFNTVLALNFFHNPSVGINFKLNIAAFAPELAFKLFLQPGFTDFEPRNH